MVAGHYSRIKFYAKQYKRMVEDGLKLWSVTFQIELLSLQRKGVDQQDDSRQHVLTLSLDMLNAFKQKQDRQRLR